MKNRSDSYTELTCAVVMGILIGHGQLALAGWTGAMNGTGYGQASVNVRAADTSLLKRKTITTTNMVNPSASMSPTAGYATNAFLPADASPGTVAKVIGFSGYIWQATTVGSDGDSTDNDELENRIKITAADCASLEMDSSSVINPDHKSGIITVNAKATAGTALWVRGIEFKGDPSELPNDDPETTDVNETIEFLKTNVNSSLKWDILLAGPFDLNTTNCNALVIPFTVETTTENLYFITDGVAKSLPLVIDCPNDIVVDCSQPVNYPPTVLVGGCGNITVTFDPPAPTGGSFPAGSFPVGTTPITVTATDKDGNTTNCTFNVIVTDTTPPVTPVIPPATGECSLTVTPPTTTDSCMGTITGTTTAPLTYTLKGTNTITWTFNDGNGNTSTADQAVIVTGVAFHGFYSPIGGTGGSCASPLRTAKLGNNLPVKFDISCNGTPVTTGTPSLSIEKSNQNCTSLTSVVQGTFTLIANAWHFNWETGSGNVTVGTYKLTATLQDGSKQFVWVKLK